METDARFGQILPGYRADLVLVDKNPLEDVRNARLISGVTINGRSIEREALEQQRDALKSRYRNLGD
jgi:imidazolonepropionase-like amidohydrolase